MNKRVIALNVMDDNADKSMAEVCQIIAKEADMSYAMARAYYTWAVETNRAPGVIVREKRGRKLGYKVTPKEPDIQVPSVDTEDANDYCDNTYNNLNNTSTERVITA